MDDIREKILYILESEEFEEYYKKYLLPMVQNSTTRREQSDYGFDFLETHLEKLKIPECHISILGIQGAGKSSLLNALIFGDEVLPVEVEETTCIPTMIRRVYPEETEGIEIHYEDETVQEAPLAKEFLEKVVDNKYNPGNMMNVEYVLCRVNREFLNEGFVFVDLPGVGSLTEKNEETTMHFLQNTHLGIFLLRTVPPITESEASFIHLAWPRLQESLFVQNLWAKETESEVEAGKAHNLKVLKQIASQRGTSYPSNIVPVNVAMACQGSYTQNQEEIIESGLENVKQQLRQYAQQSSWDKLARKTAQIFVKLIQKSQIPLRERVQLLRANKEELRQKYEECNAQMQAKQESLQEELNQLCERFFQDMENLKLEVLPEYLDSGANRIFEKMDKLPLEDMTEDMFRQEIRNAFSDEFSLVYQTIRTEMAQYAENYVNNLGEILRDISRAGELADSLEDKNKAKTIHGWGVILSGSIAPLVVGGPVGWGILGGAMLVGGVVRWISGASAHSRILRGIRKVINDGKMKVRSQIIEEIEEFTEKVAATISESIEQELDAFNLEMQAIAEDLEKQENESDEEMLEELENDIALSSQLLNALKQF